ncbi:hypothetical protein Tco_0276751 [Tanacetum coccineum]
MVDGDEVMTRVMRRWWCDWWIGGGVVTEMKMMVTVVVQRRLSRGFGSCEGGTVAVGVVVVVRWRWGRRGGRGRGGSGCRGDDLGGGGWPKSGRDLAEKMVEAPEMRERGRRCMSVCLGLGL